VLVSAQVNGTEVRSTVPDPLTGEFFLSNLSAGSYDVVIVADGHATAVISGVPVSVATGTTGATITSTSALPISLPTSTMQTLSGAITLSPASPDTAAYLATKQTVTGGPTVTVKTAGADLLSGAYSLTLPIGAPLLGSYGTGTLPIALTPQPGAAGQYAAEASATGYVAQPVSVDLSAGDVTRDFTLMP
jgi:hypothetical protein